MDQTRPGWDRRRGRAAVGVYLSDFFSLTGTSSATVTGHDSGRPSQRIAVKVGRLSRPPENETMTVATVKSPRSIARSRPSEPRAAVQHSRRRMIDPATCERDYAPEELEFMQALDRYKRTSGRMFPTCSEVLEVVQSLGYQRVTTE